MWGTASQYRPWGTAGVLRGTIYSTRGTVYSTQSDHTPQKADCSTLLPAMASWLWVELRHGARHLTLLLEKTLQWPFGRVQQRPWCLPYAQSTKAPGYCLQYRSTRPTVRLIPRHTVLFGCLNPGSTTAAARSRRLWLLTASLSSLTCLLVAVSVRAGI